MIREILFLISCVGMILANVGWCAEPIEISAEQERRFGYFVDEQVKTMFPVLEEPNLIGKVAQVGNRIVQVSERFGEEFTFRVLNTPVVNAFAGPGDYVYVSVGILDLLESRDELAALLSHEIGHVCEQHALRSFTNRETAIGAINIMNVLSTIGQLSGYSSLDLAGAAGQLAAMIIYQGFSREQESDADHKGINYAHRAGYDPEAMASLFEKLLKKEKEEENHGTLVILSSHPALQQRIANVKKWGHESKQSEDKKENETIFP